MKTETSKLDLAEKVAVTISGKYGFGKCSVWAGHSIRIYVKKFGYIGIDDQGIKLDRVNHYKQQIADLLEDLLEIVPFPEKCSNTSNNEFRNGMITRYGLSEVLDAERDVARENWDI